MSESEPLLHRVGEAAARLGASPPKRRGTRRALQGAIALLILGFLVYTVVGQWGEVREEGVHFEVGWLVPALLLIPLHFSINAFGWDLLLRMLGYRIGVLRAQAAWGQPMLARYVPGSVLYLLARLLLSEKAGVPRRITLASIIYEQAITVAAAIAVSTWFIISHPDLQGLPLRWGVLLVVPVLITLLHPAVFGRIIDRLMTAFGRESLPALIPFRGVLAMLVYFACNWVLMGLAVYFVTRSVTYVPLDQAPVVGSAQAIGFVAAVLSLVAPAGLGVRDAAFAWTVKAALPSRSFALGSLIALAVRAVLTVAELIYVGAVTVLARRRGWRAVAVFDPVADAGGGSERNPADQLEGSEGQDAAGQDAVTSDRCQR